MRATLIGILLGLIGTAVAKAFIEVEVTSMDVEPEKKHSKTSHVEPGTCCYAPLIRYYCSVNKYTTNWSEQLNDIIKNKCRPWGTVGYVATRDDCHCRDSAQLIPAYRYVSPKKTGDVFSTSDTEGQELIRSGYVKAGVAFYCASEIGQCGANHAMYRFYREKDGEYTYNIDFSEGDRFITNHALLRQHIICYTWGGQTSPYQLDGLTSG